MLRMHARSSIACALAGPTTQPSCPVLGNQAVIALRFGSSGSRFAASNTRRKVASTSTGRLHAQLRRTTCSPVFTSGSDAAPVAAAPQVATDELSATPPESEAPQFPLSAAVVAAVVAAAALVAGRDLLAAAEAVDDFPVVLAMLSYVGASLGEMLSATALGSDPILLFISLGAGAAAIWFCHIMGLIGHDSPRSNAFNSAGRADWVWHLSWHLTGAFLPAGMALTPRVLFTLLALRTGLIAACASVFRAAVVTLVTSVQYALWQCGVPRRWLPDIRKHNSAAADDMATAAPLSVSQGSSKTCSHSAAAEAPAAAAAEAASLLQLTIAAPGPAAS